MRWSTIERDLRSQHGPLLAGVDEVGRGPLAGPVVACAVIMPPDRRAMPGINDSKQLTARKRDELVLRIRERAVAIGIGAASVREIDRLNIYQASVLAIRRALQKLPVRPDHVVVDGRSIRTLEVSHTAVVHGDARCYSIACASIVAKITRDRVMHALAPRYPTYRWDQNVGYATALHLKGISAAGITPHHRKSFLPVSQISLDFGDVGSADAIATDLLPPFVGHAAPREA
jgi:ribonuclease HII